MNLRIVNLYFASAVLVFVPLGVPGGIADLLAVPAVLHLARNPRVLTNAPVGAYFAVLVLASVPYLRELVQRSGSRELLELLRLVVVFLPLAAGASIPAGRLEPARIVKFFLLGVSSAIALGMVVFYLGIQLSSNQQQLFIGNGEGSVARAGGLVGNSGGFGHLAALGLLGALFLRPHGKRDLAGLRLGTAALSVAALAASSSRAGLLNVACGLLFAAVSSASIRRKIVSLCLPAGLLLLGLAGSGALERLLGEGGSTQATLRRFDVLNLTGESTFYSSVRLSNWPIFLDISIDHPIIGAGRTGASDISGGAFVDNSYLSIMAEAGLLAGVLFVAFWISSIRRLSLSTSRVGRQAAPLVVGTAVHALFIDLQRNWYSFPILLFFLGCCLATQKPSTPESSDIGPVQTSPLTFKQFHDA